MRLEAIHLPDGGDPTALRFAVCHRPEGPCRAGVLFVHGFAEEMNKSRRMVALQSRALARAGALVLAVDLHGCGDSGGTFADASWARWTADVQAGLAWLRDQTRAPVWAWGLRSGCLLVAESTRTDYGPDHVLLWQPPASGRQLLQQFLRLRAAADAMDGGAKGVVEGLRQELAAGRAVEVAGYVVAPDLAAGLERATMEPGDGTGHACMVERAFEADSLEPSPGVRKIENSWRSAGWTASAHAAGGPSFWQTTEIEVAPAWLDLTQQRLVEAWSA